MNPDHHQVLILLQALHQLAPQEHLLPHLPLVAQGLETITAVALPTNMLLPAVSTNTVITLLDAANQGTPVLVFLILALK